MLVELDRVWSRPAEAPTAAREPARVASSAAMARGCPAETWGRLSQFLVEE